MRNGRAKRSSPWRADGRARPPRLWAVPSELPTGNTFDKYGSTNPVVRRLMSGFHGALDDMWDRAGPRSVLDVGCGEGVLTYEWAQRLGEARVVGIDLEDPKLRSEWVKRPRANLEYRAEEATRLSFGDNEFDLAAAVEVLEHVPDPEATVAEMARVAEGGSWSRFRASRCGAR